MADQNAFCMEVMRGPNSRAGATSNNQPTHEEPPTPGTSTTSFLNHSATFPGGINLNPAVTPSLTDATLSDVAQLSVVLFHEAMHINDPVAGGDKVTKARHAEIYFATMQMLCCIRDYLDQQVFPAGPYTQQEVDDAKDELCKYLEGELIPTYHDLGGDQPFSNCCTGLLVSPPPPKNNPGSGVPFPPLDPSEFGPDNWFYTTPVGRFIGSVSAASNNLNIRKRGGGQWSLPLNGILPQGTFKVTAMSGGLGTDVSFWGTVEGTGDSALVQTTVGWTGTAPVLNPGAVIFQDDGFGDVTALTNFTYAAGKYLVWDYTNATLSAIDSAGVVSLVTSWASFPQLAGKKGMFAMAPQTGGITGPIASFYFTFTDSPGTGNHHASAKSPDWFGLVDIDMDLVPDTVVD
jgi:hypothetical protein